MACGECRNGNEATCTDCYGPGELQPGPIDIIFISDAGHAGVQQKEIKVTTSTQRGWNSFPYMGARTNE